MKASSHSAPAASASRTLPRRLGRNLTAYAGDTIDIATVLGETEEMARQLGWGIERIPVSDSLDLLVLRRALGEPRVRVYFSAGIHGDEPAGPLAIRQLVRDDIWPANAEYVVLPCLNPTGFARNRRENIDGHDLNRDYRHHRTPEVRAHVAWLKRQPAFHLSLLLHEDWEAHGFYVYELNPRRLPSLAGSMIQAVAPICPIDCSPMIDGRAACDGIIRPMYNPEARPDWPEAFYLVEHLTGLNYTLEAPSDFLLPTRTSALVTAVNAALRDYFAQAG